MRVELKKMDSHELDHLIEILHKNGIRALESEIFLESMCDSKEVHARAYYGIRVKIPKRMISE